MSRQDLSVGRPGQALVEDVTFEAADGLRLRGHLFKPPSTSPSGGTAPVVVIGPAAAVPSRFYKHFAQHVAERGHWVLTFDVRDIGINRVGPTRQSRTRMRDWAIHDVAGALAFVSRRFPGQPIHWVGHSMGGFATGLAPNGHIITRQLCVATLNGYWRRMAGRERWRVLAMMGGFAPLVLGTIGYMPGRLMGGEDMPAPAFREWRRWCLHPDFLFSDETLAERIHFQAFRAPVRFLQFSDDVWGTPDSVASIASRFSASCDNHVRQVTPQMVGAKRIGHFGFFRPEFKDTLWKSELDWLLAA